MGVGSRSNLPYTAAFQIERVRQGKKGRKEGNTQENKGTRVQPQESFRHESPTAVQELRTGQAEVL